MLKKVKRFEMLLRPYFVLAVFALLGGFSTSTPAAGYTLVEVPTGQRFSMGTYDLILGRFHEERGIVWLDDRRVIFKGNRFSRDPSRDDQGIFIWNVDQKSVTRYGDEMQFCYSSGWVYLWESPRHDQKSNTSTYRYRYGPLGKEKSGVCERTEKEYSNCIREVNMSCKAVQPYWEQKPLGPESRVLVQLREGDGALVVVRSWRDLPRSSSKEERVVQSRQSVLLHNAQHPKGRPLPILEIEEIGRTAPSYSAYAGKYILVAANPKDRIPGLSTSWPEERPQIVYLLTPYGDVETLEIPKLKDWTNIFQAMPTKKGLVFKGVHGRTGGGLFLYDGARVDPIDRGQVGTLSVSPDGCKVAFSIINNYDKTTDITFRLKYADICGRE